MSHSTQKSTQHKPRKLELLKEDGDKTLGDMGTGFQQHRK